LYYVPSTSPNVAPRRLTDLNGEIASRALGKQERFEWQGPNGFREDGVVTYPPGFTRDRRYPLVLVIHGGPTSASVQSFSFLPQLLAAHDYVVFEPNYRGSDNRGNAYKRAIFNDAGDGPGRDVMAGVTALVRLGAIDSTRIAVSGWSYGGYMTTWLIGHYHLWKVAMAGAAVTNLVDQYNLSDGNVVQRNRFGGSPWTGKYLEAYRAQSPISYVRTIKTPTLILSNTGDFRVPVAQSYELYHALKDNGVPVKFVAYPVSGHFPNDPVRVTDVYRRWVDWLDLYLQESVSRQ
jgi:dipeptidyl aminopeptidase/acylaminoacyl peptidase